MRCCAAALPAKATVAAHAAAAMPLAKSRMIVSPSLRLVGFAASLRADRKGVERRTHARMRGWCRPTQILERGFEMTQIGNDVGLADHTHRPDADDLAGLARMPRSGDHAVIALAHVLDDDTALETLRHLHGDNGRR